MFLISMFLISSLNPKEREILVQHLAQLHKLTEHYEFRDDLKEALRDRMVCRMLNISIQKRLLAEKDLTLQKAMDRDVSILPENLLE